ncbi:uncharacterized protein LOC110689023 [Chenopodium quinoa]|uniref:uncharacterized protein LOC110689023 n=1 Tax=Chenopodium quinoa TaxID=63459 RepID=UPI000B7826CD|nr:uncharacterized protein LOC110689023 [Chenopodium quinoa]
MSGRMEKWALHLSRYDIQHEPRTAIKSQALADFVVDFSPALEEEAQKEVLALQEPKATQKWTLHTDDATNIRGVGLGVVLTSPQRDKLARAIRCNFKATNNEAEYEALITGLTVARDMKIQHLEVISDSLLMVNQINEEYAAKDARMIAYLEVTRRLIKGFKEFKIDQVPRNLNTEADALANLGSNINPEEFRAIPLVHVLSPAIEKEATMNVHEIQTDPVGEEESSWTKPLKDYLQDKIVPAGKVAASALALRASKYCLISNVLFKMSVAGPFLRCLENEEAQQVLQSLHSGKCGNHSGGRNLANRALGMGYYWPSMRKEAAEFAKKCLACQKHAPLTHKPSEELHPTLTPWPFMKWGMDIVKLPPS